MKLVKKPNHKRKGAALISSLLLVAAVASMGAGLVQLSSVSTRRQNHSIDTTRALYVAEAALSEAYFAVGQGRSGILASTTEPATFGGGYYWVEATELTGNQVELKATGMHGRGKFTLGLVLNRSVNQVGSMGMCGLDEVYIGQGTQIDSTPDTTAAGAGGALAVGPPPATDKAPVRSNGDITIIESNPLLGAAQTTINGDVSPGPEGIADLDPGVIVTGSTGSSARGMTLPSFSIPKLGGSAGAFMYPKDNTTVTLNADTYYDGIEVPPNMTLVLEGPMRLRADHFVLGAGASLVIDTTHGPVGMYTTKTTLFDYGSQLTSVEKDPTKFTLFALTPDRTDKSVVTMAARGEFYGMLIAPRSIVDIPQDLRLNGSVVAESLHIGAQAHLTFAESLKKGGYGVKMTPTLVSWQILEVPDTPLTSGTGTIDQRISDLALGTVPTDVASAESVINLNYFDGIGTFTTYTGPSTAIPWGNVNSIDSLNWFQGVTALPTVRPSIVIDAVDNTNGTVDLVDAPTG